MHVSPFVYAVVAAVVAAAAVVVVLSLNLESKIWVYKAYVPFADMQL